MSMTKMECVIDWYVNNITLDGKATIEDVYYLLDALHAGSKALDILSRVSLNLDSGWELREASELLREWN